MSIRQEAVSKKSLIDDQPKIEFVSGSDPYIQWLGKEELEAFFEEIFPKLKDLGVEGLQSWLRWKLIEPEKDCFDWTYYDLVVELLQKYDLKFVPAILIGPACATPDWFKYSSRSLFFRCLEHNVESRCQSIWNPCIRDEIVRIYERVAQRYKEQIIHVVIGLNGDMGEAIFPTSYLESGAASFLPRDEESYHGHPGLWCGDVLAIIDFQRYVLEKYQSLDRINQVWKTNFNRLDRIRPRIKEYCSSEIRWLDQVNWVYKSITDYAEFCLRTAHKFFPDKKLFLLAGGGGEAILGANFTQLAKIASQYNAGLRETGEHSNYGLNFIWTRPITSPCKFYGAHYGFEPAAEMSFEGLNARIFNVISSGAHHYFEYFSNILKDIVPREIGIVYELTPWSGFCHLEDSRERRKFFKEWKEKMVLKRPKVEVAAFIPRTHLDIYHPNEYLILEPEILEDKETGKPKRLWLNLITIRDMVDIDFVDELMILDGALDRYRFLVVNLGEVTERDVMERIVEWIENGGVLISRSDCFKRDLFGKADFRQTLFGITGKTKEENKEGKLKTLNGKLLPSLKSVTVHRSYSKLSNEVKVLAESEYGACIWNKMIGKGIVFCFSGTHQEDAAVYLNTLFDIFSNISLLIPEISSPKIVDEIDGVYITQFEEGLIIYNSNGYEVKKEIAKKEVILPPYTVRLIES